MIIVASHRPIVIARGSVMVIDTIAQGILFESQAKFDRMQAFLDRRAAKAAAKAAQEEEK